LILSLLILLNALYTLAYPAKEAGFGYESCETSFLALYSAAASGA
jgi:hypothetical protein